MPFELTASTPEPDVARLLFSSPCLQVIGRGPAVYRCNGREIGEPEYQRRMRWLMVDRRVTRGEWQTFRHSI